MCWQKEKQLLTFVFFWRGGEDSSSVSQVSQTISSGALLSQPSASGTDERIMRERVRQCEKEREVGGVVEGPSLTKAEERRGWSWARELKKKGKQARIKALGNSTRVLSEWGGGQKPCSSKTKEDHGLGRCQPTLPFVYSLIKGQPLPQKLENFLKDLMRQTERKLACGRTRRAKLKHIKVDHILCLQTAQNTFLFLDQQAVQKEA